MIKDLLEGKKARNVILEMAYKQVGNAWSGWHGTNNELFYKLWKHMKNGGKVKVVVPDEVDSEIKKEYYYLNHIDPKRFIPNGINPGEILSFKGKETHSFSQGSDSGVGSSESFTLIKEDGTPITLSVASASTILEFIDFQDFKPEYIKVYQHIHAGWDSISLNTTPNDSNPFKVFGMGFLKHDEDYNIVMDEYRMKLINEKTLPDYGMSPFTLEDFETLIEKIVWKPKQYRNVDDGTSPWFKTFELYWKG